MHSVHQAPNPATFGQKFGSQADDYEKGRFACSQKLLDQIVREVSTYKLEEIQTLDLGCGTGISTRALYERGFINITGLDIDPGMLERAKSNPANSSGQIPYIMGNALDVKTIFGDKKFDLITACTSFHWFCTALAVKSIHSLLNPGGIFVVALGVDGEDKDAHYNQAKFWQLIESIQGSPKHNPYQNYEPEKVLEENGFEVSKYIFFSYVEYDFETVLAKRRSFSGWCNMTDEQKVRGEPLLREFVKQQIIEQKYREGVLKVLRRETCLIAKRKPYENACSNE